jgi:hypothetical protein
MVIGKGLRLLLLLVVRYSLVLGMEKDFYGKKLKKTKQRI